MTTSSSQSLPTRPLRFLAAMSKPYALSMWASIAFSVVAQTLATSVAYVFRGVVDSATRFANGQETYAMLLIWVAAYPVVVTLAELCWRGSGFIGMRWSTGLRKNAYATLFEYLSRHSYAFFSRKFAGALGSSINNAVNGLGALVESFLWNYLPTAVAAVVTVILAATTNLSLGLVFLFWIALIIPVNFLFARRISRFSQESAANQSKLRGFTVDIISNIAAVHSFARRGFEAGNIEQAASEQRKFSLRSWMASEILLTVNSVFLALFTTSVVGTAFYLWHGGAITLGSFIMALTLVGNIVWVILFIGSALNSFATNIGEVKNGLTDIIVTHEIRNSPGATPLPLVKGLITFGRVSFGYSPDRPIFKNFMVTPVSGSASLAPPAPARRRWSRSSSAITMLILAVCPSTGTMCAASRWRACARNSVRPAGFASLPSHSAGEYRVRKARRDRRRDRGCGEEGASAWLHLGFAGEGYATLVGERGVKLSGGRSG